MSSAHQHPPHAESFNEDGVNIKKIVLVGVVSLVIFALSAVVAWAMLVTDTARLHEEQGVPPTPTEIGKDEIGIIDMIEFDADRRLEEWTAAKKKRLSTYGWSDRSKSLIHIPIDKAMDEIAAQAGGSGAR